MPEITGNPLPAEKSDVCREKSRLHIKESSQGGKERDKKE
jgi:hypothetical protein